MVLGTAALLKLGVHVEFAARLPCHSSCICCAIDQICLGMILIIPCLNSDLNVSIEFCTPLEIIRVISMPSAMYLLATKVSIM
jgi:hypothetical protein